MRIELYLNDETHITTLYDKNSNPFKVGDIVHLSVDELAPKDFTNFNDKGINVLKEINENLKDKFHLKSIKLIRENKYLELEKSKLIIEYFCEIVNNIQTN